MHYCENLVGAIRICWYPPTTLAPLPSPSPTTFALAHSFLGTINSSFLVLPQSATSFFSVLGFNLSHLSLSFLHPPQPSSTTMSASPVNPSPFTSSLCFLPITQRHPESSKSPSPLDLSLHAASLSQSSVSPTSVTPNFIINLALHHQQYPVGKMVCQGHYLFEINMSDSKWAPGHYSRRKNRRPPCIPPVPSRQPYYPGQVIFTDRACVHARTHDFFSTHTRTTANTCASSMTHMYTYTRLHTRSFTLTYYSSYIFSLKQTFASTLS